MKASFCWSGGWVAESGGCGNGGGKNGGDACSRNTRMKGKVVVVVKIL